LYTGSESGKILALRNLIATGKLPYPSLIFVQSVERAEELYKTLVLDGGGAEAGGLRVEAVHGNKTVAARDKAIEGFRKGDIWVLVVTEVLARGMDFRGVKVVINYGQSPTTLTAPCLASPTILLWQ
jgi:ATP-dependent RNA helicase DDX52/ROK1